jgi:hypothetical protein
MKTKLPLFSALAFVALCFNGCTPDEAVTTQNQFKPLIIRVTLANPITQSSEALGTIDQLSVQDNNFMQTISGEFPNQVGLGIIERSTTAVSNTPLVVYVDYLHINGYDALENPIYQCNTVNLELIFDGQTVYSESRNLGSEDGSCPDGYAWAVSYTLP